MKLIELNIFTTANIELAHVINNTRGKNNIYNKRI